MRRTRGGIAALTGTLCALVGAGTAQAGVYTVYACNAAGRAWDNRAWELTAPVRGISADQDCAGDGNIGLNQGAGDGPPTATRPPCSSSPPRAPGSPTSG